MNVSRTPRPGYTLLEVLLASAIAVLLMAALYVGMDIQVRAIQAGREKVNETALVRNLIARMSADAVGTITPISATVAVTSSTGEATTDPVIPFNGGVQGDNQVLTLWVSKVPKLPTGTDSVDAASQQLLASDLHRISYWLADGGLAEQDVDRVSAAEDDPDTALPPDVGADSKYFTLVAPEVTELNFRYFDGETWQDTWDGTVLGEDGKTPIGPPRAIEVTLSIRRPGADPNDQNAVKQYRQVIPVNAANAQSSATATTTTTGTTGGTSP
ncbi:MAG TPA: type II secretion system protein GspJ [Gemmataceae bacterium]|jgi:prepilin-type N-terminal cleavage/methylation domain-containing protein|nr:type II secretion system protein GspJ [Gemmataceae bacterium]